MTALEELLAIMRRLRGPDGCPWDREQNFRTIAPYTIEEAFEVADAIERGEMGELRDELGDLLFQVVFHARMAEEAGHFRFEDVAAAICAKLVRRHPHVFADESVDDADAQTRAWERHKAAERARSGRGLFDDVPPALPALQRAVKLGRRAATVGFDWPDVGGVLAKVREEIGEVEAELAAGAPTQRVEEELGDVLFALANLTRHLGVDAEGALRGANVRFERRFGAMQRVACERGVRLEDCDLADLESLWAEAKRAVG